MYYYREDKVYSREWQRFDIQQYACRMFWDDETLFQSKAEMLFTCITALSSATTFLIVYYANLQFAIWL